MRKIMTITSKTISALEREDYAKAAELMTNDDYHEIRLVTKREFDSAIEHNCQVYQKLIKYPNGSEETHLFIRVNRQQLFKIAEKAR